MAELTLFHNRFSASSQKVRLVLAEKGLAFESREIDLASGEQHGAAYRAINPRGVVPSLRHGAVVMVETAALLEYLDDIVAEPPLRPTDVIARQRMRAFIRRMDDLHHPANGLIHYAVAGRKQLQALPPERLEALLTAMPHPRDRALRRAAAIEGIEGPQFAEAVRIQEEMLDLMEAMLGKTDWLAGEAVSLADFTALPYVVRLEQIGLGALLNLNHRPALAGWLHRITSRPSYRIAIADALPPAVLALWQEAGRQTLAQVAKLLRHPICPSN